MAKADVFLGLTEFPGLLREDDQVLFADTGYRSDTYRRGARYMGSDGV